MSRGLLKHVGLGLLNAWVTAWITEWVISWQLGLACYIYIYRKKALLEKRC